MTQVSPALYYIHSRKEVLYTFFRELLFPKLWDFLCPKFIAQNCRKTERSSVSGSWSQFKWFYFTSSSVLDLILHRNEYSQFVDLIWLNSVQKIVKTRFWFPYIIQQEDAVPTRGHSRSKLCSSDSFVPHGLYTQLSRKVSQIPPFKIDNQQNILGSRPSLMLHQKGGKEETARRVACQWEYRGAFEGSFL